MVKHGAEIVPIDSTWVDDGTSLGSNDVAALKTPKILLVWDAPTQSLSAGWTRYTLERRFGAAVTAVRAGSLGRANFNDYDVIVLPSGNYGVIAWNEGISSDPRPVTVPDGGVAELDFSVR